MEAFFIAVWTNLRVCASITTIKARMMSPRIYDQLDYTCSWEEVRWQRITYDGYFKDLFLTFYLTIISTWTNPSWRRRILQVSRLRHSARLPSNQVALQQAEQGWTCLIGASHGSIFSSSNIVLIMVKLTLVDLFLRQYVYNQKRLSSATQTVL